MTIRVAALPSSGVGAGVDVGAGVVCEGLGVCLIEGTTAAVSLGEGLSAGAPSDGGAGVGPDAPQAATTTATAKTDPRRTAITLQRPPVYRTA